MKKNNYIIIILIFSVLVFISILSIKDIKLKYHNSSDSLYKLRGVVCQTLFEKDQIGGFFLQFNVVDNNNISTLKYSKKNQIKSGIYVKSNLKVNVGDEIIIKGKIVEKNNQFEVHNPFLIDMKSTNNKFIINDLKPPFTPEILESYEGSLVRINHELFLTNSYNYLKYGQLKFSTELLTKNTELFSNVDSIKNHEIIQFTKSIYLDDLSNKKYPTSENLYLNPTIIKSILKCKNIIGFLTQYKEKYFIRVINQIDISEKHLNHSYKNYLDKNLILNLNVQNLFNGDNESQDFSKSRGAKNQDQYDLQLKKIGNLINTLKPKIITLMEIENDGNNSSSTIFQLTNFLNKNFNFSYKFPLIDGNHGNDVIKSTILYDSLYFNDDIKSYYLKDTLFSRYPLFHKFSTQNDLKFTICVNHFKSKSPYNASGKNLPQNDGQGAFNFKRELQARFLVNHINKNHLDENIIILGDFNSYSKETPIKIISDHFYKFKTKYYSYVYKGLRGNLDHVFCNHNFKKNISMVEVLDINAKYPNWIGYKYNEFSDESYYRCSDHNPIIIQIDDL